MSAGRRGRSPVLGQLKEKLGDFEISPHMPIMDLGPKADAEILPGSMSGNVVVRHPPIKSVFREDTMQRGDGHDIACHAGLSELLGRVQRYRTELPVEVGTFIEAPREHQRNGDA